MRTDLCLLFWPVRLGLVQRGYKYIGIDIDVEEDVDKYINIYIYIYI